MEYLNKQLSLCELQTTSIFYLSSSFACNIGIKNLDRKAKMAALIGNIGPFDEKSEKFSDYADRFEVYLAANDNAKKVNVFLVVIGPDAYKLLKNLCDAENPNTKTFVTAVARTL